MDIVGDDNHSTIEKAVLSALDGLRYGSVEITVHDGRIVQIERKEKIRPNELPREQKT